MQDIPDVDLRFSVNFDLKNKPFLKFHIDNSNKKLQSISFLQLFAWQPDLKKNNQFIHSVVPKFRISSQR